MTSAGRPSASCEIHASTKQRQHGIKRLTMPPHALAIQPPQTVQPGANSSLSGQYRESIAVSEFLSMMQRLVTQQTLDIIVWYEKKFPF